MRLVSLLLIFAVACGGSVRKPGSCDGPCPVSKIDHLVVVVQENHTFDNYFARWCTAPAGSSPTCTSGPGCCEAGPDPAPGGAAPVALDDAENGRRQPDHTRACETAEANGGAMDRYAAGAEPCSDPGNVAYAPATIAQPYWDLAAGGALADHWFQPIAGASSANDMYLWRAQFVFDDDDVEPDADGKQCSFTTNVKQYSDANLGTLLDAAGVSWAWYQGGYDAIVAASATSACPKAPADCPADLSIYPCVVEPGDLPVDYYAGQADNPKVMRDYDRFAQDLHDGTLPQVVFVRAIGYRSEHPALGTTISAGTAWVKEVVDAVEGSDYAPDTLVLVTWDEGGGYFDHVTPPGMGSDGQPYGTRVPAFAVGPMAAAGTISHVVLEHASIVKFVEWNWTGQVGQLGGRDASVANLGSLLDASKTGVAVPAS
jgi:phospholipase C